MEASVIKALQKAVIAAVAASILPTLPVKYIGIPFTKPDTGGWLELVHIPNNVLNEHWGPEKTYRGMLRLILHWPMVADGIYGPLDTIESIASYFAKGTKFTDTGGAIVKISDVPDFMGPMEEAPELLLPYSISYEFFAA